MRIKLNLQIFIFIIIFIITNQIRIYSFIMFFGFLHECGHLIIGLIMNFKPKALHINPFGLAITFENYETGNRNNIKAILIALAGPITNLLIIFISYFLILSNEIKELIIYSNILIIIFNMLPIYPLDGGRILKGILKIAKNDNLKVDSIINKISYITIILITVIFSILVLVLRNIALLGILFYLWIIIIKEEKKYRLKKSIYDIIKKENKYLEVTNDKK